MVYLPNVGEYASPMDAMGKESKQKSAWKLAMESGPPRIYCNTPPPRMPVALGGLQFLGLGIPDKSSVVSVAGKGEYPKVYTSSGESTRNDVYIYNKIYKT